MWSLQKQLLVNFFHFTLFVHWFGILSLVNEGSRVSVEYKYSEKARRISNSVSNITEPVFHIGDSIKFYASNVISDFKCIIKSLLAAFGPKSKKEDGRKVVGCCKVYRFLLVIG